MLTLLSNCDVTYSVRWYHLVTVAISPPFLERNSTHIPTPNLAGLNLSNLARGWKTSTSDCFSLRHYVFQSLRDWLGSCCIQMQLIQRLSWPLHKQKVTIECIKTLKLLKLLLWSWTSSFSNSTLVYLVLLTASHLYFISANIHIQVWYRPQATCYPFHPIHTATWPGTSRSEW